MTDMKRITFYADTNRSGNLLHIETDGAVVNIRVGLTDSEGRQVTSIMVNPDDESRGGDGSGYVWDMPDGPIGGRLVRRPHLGEPGNPAYFAGMVGSAALSNVEYVTVIDAGRNVIHESMPREQAEDYYPANRPYDGLSGDEA